MMSHPLPISIARSSEDAVGRISRRHGTARLQKGDPDGIAASSSVPAGEAGKS